MSETRTIIQMTGQLNCIRVDDHEDGEVITSWCVEGLDSQGRPYCLGAGSEGSALRLLNAIDGKDDL